MNRFAHGRFFEPEEPWLAGTGAFLAGYPGFFAYVPLILIAGAALSGIYALNKKGRAPLYFLWLPAALLAILITKFLLPQHFTYQFTF
jgi:hypothetical protein